MPSGLKRGGEDRSKSVKYILGLMSEVSERIKVSKALTVSISDSFRQVEE